MIASRFNRIRRMTLDEGRWRARELAQTVADRIRCRFATPEWPSQGDVEAARAIADRLGTGPSRFVIDPSMADPLRRRILSRFPGAAADASARADRILAGNYDLLGYRGLRFAGDWHLDPVHQRRAPRRCWAEVPYLDPATGDHKIIWELNRHQYWLQLGRAYRLTGDTRYTDAIVGQMNSWLAANPPLTGINWASMLEIGLRAISWTAAIHLIPLDRWLADALAAIERQLTHVERHLSYYFSPNTHLTGEALALYVVGQAFPELGASERWVRTGRRILMREIDRQVLPDGGHVERSTHYQRYTLDFYLLALLTARRTADIDAARTFADAATRLAEFTRLMADDAGRLPLIGDDDGGMLWPMAGRDPNDVRDSLAVAAVVLDRPDLAPWGLTEEAYWIAGPEVLAAEERSSSSPPSSPVSRTLPAAGYIVMRDAAGHAVLDAGAHGYLNGGHAHADALSLTLTLGTRPLLVDPGTSTYTMNPRLRDRMRGSFNHNTVSIDGRQQSIPAGPFHWRTMATGHLNAARHNPGFDWVEGAHDGYAPIEHRRSVIRARDAGWLVVDQVRLDGAWDSGLGTRDSGSVVQEVHEAAAHWHFHPGWMVRDEGSGRLLATHFDGTQTWLLFDTGDVTLRHGDEESGLGWFAPVYGTLLPTWTARVKHAHQLPFSMVTWIGGSAGAPPSLERLAVTGDSTHADIAVRVVNGDEASVYLVRHGERADHDPRGCGVGDYQTNARMLHARTRGRSLLALDLADASHALALRDGWLSIAANEPMRDLHLAIADGRLDLDASEPPTQLQLEGQAIVGLHEMRLNGRPCAPTFASRLDTLLISGSNWTSPSLVHSGKQFALDEVRPDECEEISPLRESSW